VRRSRAGRDPPTAGSAGGTVRSLAERDRVLTAVRKRESVRAPGALRAPGRIRKLAWSADREGAGRGRLVRVARASLRGTHRLVPTGARPPRRAAASAHRLRGRAVEAAV